MDSIDYADPETINGLNIYAYCGNNPVMGYDPYGTWNWGLFWEIIANVVSVAIGVIVGSCVAVTTGKPVLAFGTAVATTGAVNNVINAIYY